MARIEKRHSQRSSEHSQAASSSRSTQQTSGRHRNTQSNRRVNNLGECRNRASQNEDVQAHQNRRNRRLEDQHDSQHLNQHEDRRESQRHNDYNQINSRRSQQGLTQSQSLDASAILSSVNWGFVAIIAAGIAALVLVVSLISCAGNAVMGALSKNNYNGSVGITNTALFSPHDTSTTSVDMIIPTIFAPARPGLATISGTKRDGGDAFDTLSTATQEIEDNGYKVGYALIDLTTGITISYNADSSFYSASSIKGPYVVALTKYELGASVTRESSRITNIIEWSDNSAYSSLRSVYGNASFATLAEASGATSMSATGATEEIEQAAQLQSGDSITDNNYEYLSPNQMVALWRECYTFLSSNEDGAEWLSEVFTLPEDSAIRSTAGAIGTTWSKAGWYPGDDAYATTVDAGVVRTNTGDVVLCVMTNDPEDFEVLESIVSPLIALRSALVD